MNFPLIAFTLLCCITGSSEVRAELHHFGAYSGNSQHCSEYSWTVLACFSPLLFDHRHPRLVWPGYLGLPNAGSAEAQVSSG